MPEMKIIMIRHLGLFNFLIYGLKTSEPFILGGFWKIPLDSNARAT
ncbi:hypothetical protein SAMN02745181_1631 [Rubritalea squalenifaciens DSM 18772]|uniref:Uncharacterized protein n=2 Tax=Rubritalea TaxID=361050 RepID=A0A1M6HZQ6_9BACT|nr:hypothetical protein SAMN02745181_1631 [Rubritalea squalenifaciens DSM 18772]